MTPEQREDLIQALNRLGDPDDSSALTAARQAAELVNGQNMSWDELLANPQDDSEPEVDEAPAAPPVPELTEQAASSEENKEALALIDKLLERDLFEGTRDELLAYKDDISAGEFQADDLRYLHALDKRLAGKKKK